jgi:hypothetical protein
VFWKPPASIIETTGTPTTSLEITIHHTIPKRDNMLPHNLPPILTALYHVPGISTTTSCRYRWRSAANRPSDVEQQVRIRPVVLRLEDADLADELVAAELPLMLHQEVASPASNGGTCSNTRQLYSPNLADDDNKPRRKQNIENNKPKIAAPASPSIPNSVPGHTPGPLLGGVNRACAVSISRAVSSFMTTVTKRYRMFATLCVAGLVARRQNAHAMSETERRCGSWSGVGVTRQRRRAECAALRMFIMKMAPEEGLMPRVWVASVAWVG